MVFNAAGLASIVQAVRSAARRGDLAQAERLARRYLAAHPKEWKRSRGLLVER